MHIKPCRLICASKRQSFLSFIFIFFAFSAFSERYQISEVTYELDKTRPADLKRTVVVNTSKIFNTHDEFDSYLKDLKLRLMNTRAFQAVEIEFSEQNENKENSNDVIKIKLHIQATDSKHLLILPYPKYDSNDGLIMKIKVKDVNFLGTLNTMDAGVFAGIKEDTHTGDQNPTFGAEFDYKYPFYAGPFVNSWNNSFNLQYTCGINELEFKSGTGFTFELPFNKISYILTLTQKASRNPEYKKYGDELYYSTDAIFSTPVKVFDIENWGYFFWTPFIESKVNYDKDKISKYNDDLASPVLSAGQTVSTSRVNWNGNFRTGLSAKLGHSIGYDFMQEEVDKNYFGEIQLFKDFTYIGINSRFSFFITYSNRNIIGEKLRGVRDKQYYLNTDIKALKTPSALVLNMDIPIHLITTHWLDWSNSIFGEDSWFSKTFAWTDKFNFELQVSPFIDIAITKNEITGRMFSLKDGWYTGGIEFLVFPERWKGIVMRASLGIDLGRAVISKKYPEKIDMSWRDNVKSYEIYAGIGLHY